MSIIFGTDFSNEAMKTGHCAAAIAARLGERIVLVHVVDPMRPGTVVEEPVLGRAADCLRNEADGLRALGAEVEEDLLIGAPDEAILEAARARRARFVMLGALGRRAAPRWSVGSVAERTVQDCPVPVIVVRDAMRMVGWAREQRPLRVIVGGERSATFDAAVHFLRELERVGPLEPTVAHVFHPSLEADRLGLRGHGDDERVRAVIARDLSARLREMGESFRIVTRASYETTGRELVDLAAEERADLLVVGTHQRHGLAKLWYGSVSQAALQLASMSVACVPPQSDASHVEERLPRYRAVLAATDLSTLGDLAVRHACTVAGAEGEVHVCTAVSAADRRDSEKIAKEMKERVPRSRAAGARTFFHVERGDDPARAICQVAERIGADLVCVASHGRSGVERAVLGSVAQELLRLTERPVLVVREATDV
ncbi:MAG: universal stress protein [Acidobacteriota bacterium]